MILGTVDTVDATFTSVFLTEFFEVGGVDTKVVGLVGAGGEEWGGRGGEEEAKEVEKDDDRF